MSQQDPIRIFVTHAWSQSEDYLRVFEYIESARNFFYTNLSAPQTRPPGNMESERDALRLQIGRAEVVIALGALSLTDFAAVEFQLLFARATHKPVLMLPVFGVTKTLPKTLFDLVSDTLTWDGRAIVDAIRHHARGENTARWDVIDFKPD